MEKKKADELAKALKNQDTLNESEKQRLATEYQKNLTDAKSASDEDKQKALELLKQQEADKLAQALKDQKDKDETERQRLADNYDKNLKSAQQASDEDKRKALEDMEKKKADELAKALKNQETLNEDQKQELRDLAEQKRKLDIAQIQALSEKEKQAINSNKIGITEVRGQNALLKLEHESLQKEFSEHKINAYKEIKGLKEELKTAYTRLREQSQQSLSKNPLTTDKENKPMKTKNHEHISEHPTVRNNKLTEITKRKTSFRNINNSFR